MSQREHHRPARKAKRHVGSDHGATNAPDAGAIRGFTAPTTAVEVVHALQRAWFSVVFLRTACEKLKIIMIF